MIDLPLPQSWFLIFVCYRNVNHLDISLKMEFQRPDSPSNAKRPRQETNFKLCIVCQRPASDGLVTEPESESYSRFLSFVHKRGQYGDGEFPEISRRLENVTDTYLEANKAKWHRKCDSETCHTGHLERARKRYEKACQQQESLQLQKKRGHPSCSSASNQNEQAVAASNQTDTLRFTRSATPTYNKELRFFCLEDNSQELHEVSSFNAGEQIRKAVEQSANETWKVQLSAAINADDARAIDVKYHPACWVKHVQRAPKRDSQDRQRPAEDTNVGVIASDIEFLSLVKSLLTDGTELNMSELHSTYCSILETHGVNILPQVRDVKQKISSHIDNVHFKRPKSRRKSELVFNHSSA